MRHAQIAAAAATALLATLQARAAEQARDVGPFSSISNGGPVDLRIEVGKPPSVLASGSDDDLADLRTEVVDGELRIRMRHDTHGHERHRDALKLTITTPRLTAFTMGGAGETTLVHMSGDALDIHFGGAGNLKAEGTVKSLTLDVGGVGSIDTRALHAESVEAHVGGVGSVKVWASRRLDAWLGGVGSLTYYGDPAQVSTHSGGLGSISKGR